MGSLAMLANYAVAAFGGFICLACLLGIMFPRWLVEAVRELWKNKGSMTLAIIARVLLGSLLIYCAPRTKFPIPLRIFGVLGLVAAVALPLIGWQRVDDLMAWYAGRPAWLLRSGLGCGFCLGAFVLYAVL